MSHTTIIYLVAAGTGLVSTVLWAFWVLAPAWASYRGGWERALAVAASLYVLIAMMALGGGIGLLVLYNYNRI